MKAKSTLRDMAISAALYGTTLGSGLKFFLFFWIERVGFHNDAI